MFILAWVIISLLSALYIAYDLYHHPQKMRIMNSVWIINALWGGAFVLWAYFNYGREAAPLHTHYDEVEKASQEKMQGMAMEGMTMPKRKRWQSLSLNALHCGAGCTLADMLVFTLSFFVSFSFWGQWLTSYVVALVIGVFFQYCALREMNRHSDVQTLIKKAAMADFWSLTAWQLGMLIGQILLQKVWPHPTILIAIFIMQVAMGVGFLFAYPMNALLVKKGIKHLM